MLALILSGSLFCTGAAAGSIDITAVEASYSAGTVYITGTTQPDILAVAVQVYADETPLRLETAGVTDGAFATAIAITLTPGTYTVRAANYEGGEYLEAVFTVTTPPSDGAVTQGSSAYTAEVSDGSSLTVNLDMDTNNASVALDTITGGLADGDTIIVTLPAIPGADAYTGSLPLSALSGTSTGSLTMNTGIGSITVPGNMLSGTGLTGRSAEITICTGDKEELPDDIKEAIGDKPLIRITLSVDSILTDWNNPDAPVTISVPYTPSEEELLNPESIVIWYVDGSGNVVTVPNGHYDAVTGTVVFSTIHFSDYAVAFYPVNFNDVAAEAWYYKPVRFIAARNITEGTGGGNFSPEAKLTRGEFIVLMMRAYGLEPDISPVDNFSDAGNTYYTGYLSAAKRLGITAGVGNNMYAPDNQITRQEVFTLLYNALKGIDQVPQGDSGKTVLDFSDTALISTWAQEAMAIFVETGTVGGSDGKLNPTGTSTRAEMAQVLYNLMGKLS